MKNVVTLKLAGKLVFATNVAFNDAAGNISSQFFKMSPVACRELQNACFNLDHVVTMEEVKYRRNYKYQEDPCLDEEYGDRLDIKLSNGRVIKMYDMTLDMFQSFLAEPKKSITTMKMNNVTSKKNVTKSVIDDDEWL